MDREALACLLARLAPQLAGLSSPWSLFGSAALLLRGIDVGPIPDLDILVGEPDALRLETAWSAWREAGYAPDPHAPFRSRFSRYAFPEGAVEVMGGLAFQGPDGWRDLGMPARDEVMLEGRAWPVPAVADHLRILRLFGRPKDLVRADRLASHLTDASTGSSPPT